MRIKSCFYALTAFSVGILLASCNNAFNLGNPPPPATHAPVVVLPLRLDKPKKIAWAQVKAEPARPVVSPLAWDKLPRQPEDTMGYKPFKYPVQEAEFDYSSLPGKKLDIDLLPSRLLKFKTYALPAPRLVTGLKPEAKDGHLPLLPVGSEQTSFGTSATRVLRDGNGFLWIACSEGIYRYDGENLLLFLSFPDEHEDYGMIQDNEGNIWLPDPNGPLMVLEPKAGLLKKYAPNQGVDGLQHLMPDGQQRIWATCQKNEIKIIDTRTQTVKILDNKSGLAVANRTAGIAMDKTGKIWISTGGGGLDIFDVAHKEIKYLDHTHGLASNRVNNILLDSKGQLWVGMYGGLLQVINGEKKSIQTIGEMRSAADNMMVTCLSEDNKGRVWIGTTLGGVSAFDQQKREVWHIDKNDGLAANRIFDIRPDNNGQVWIGTKQGLNLLTGKEDALEQSGSYTATNLMEDRHGLIWQASDHGIEIVDRKTHTSRHLGVKQGLANDTVFFIEQNNGNFFISTAASMDIVDTLKKTVTHFKSNYSNILFDKAGGIYFLDHDEKGIYLYNPQSRTLKYYSREILGNENIFFLCLDTLGRIWFSNAVGEVKVIDPGAGTVQSLTNLQREKKDTWVHFMPDNRGNIWIGTGRGIYIADIKNQKLVYFSVAQGLINNKVTSMVQRGPSVYAGTSQGVTVITPPGADISAAKGWRSVSYALTKQNPINYNADLVTRDGTYWLGDAGATAITLGEHNSYRSVPYIRGISVYDHSLYFFDENTFQTASSDTLWQANGETPLPRNETPVNTSYAFRNGFRWDSVAGPGNAPVNLQIPYNQNFLHLHYGNLNLTPHDTTRYRYILNGVDKDWSAPTTDTSTLNYMNLQPGSYSFELICSNADNTWSSPANFSFTINPPWWKTWWAYILYAVIFLSAIWCFVHYRSLQLIKEKRELEHKINLATEEIIQQKEEIAAQRDSLETQRDDLKNTLIELKATQTQLIQSEKMASLGELTAGIAHEIQNPLNFVNNFSEVSVELLEELKEEAEAGNTTEIIAIADDLVQNLEKIQHHGKRADAIVKGMLEHSRTSKGEKILADLNTLADEFLKLSYHGIRAKDKDFNAELITHFDKTLPEVEVIPQDIGRVLLNLFNNAFYAVNQRSKTAGADYQPTVEVNTSRKNGHIEIRVKDNGNGIPDAIKDKIMQPFFTTKPTGEGTGLGLSLSYDIVVKGHGGSINMDSTDGDGAEFTIYLPII